MKVVIQCAARKELTAGFFRTSKGLPVSFVARPDQVASPEKSHIYARPDDPSDEPGRTWRDRLFEYNSGRANPMGLLPAYRLYRRQIYRDAVARLGVTNVFILSAGWGLIRSDWLTPYYDITFSASADPYKRRRASDVYADFWQLPLDTEEEVIFFGGKDYRPLFYDLTRMSPGRKIVMYNSANISQEPDFLFQRYESSAKTNWHYLCFRDWLAGNLAVGAGGG